VKFFRFVLALSLLTCVNGCGPQIPNKVSPEEYAVYRAWVSQYFQKSAPKELLFLASTITQDPLEPNGCGDNIHKAGVSWQLIKQMHANGSAHYPLDFGYVPDPGLPKLPWKSSMLYQGGFSEIFSKRGKYNLISFTRVAFNRSKSEGLFFFEDSNGQRGVAGFRRARLVNNEWIFEEAGCDWVSIS
jgi:hypothetical protein